MPARRTCLCLTLLAASALGACHDPDVYLRHAKDDGGAGIAILTGEAGAPGNAGVTGAGDTTGAAGEIGGAGSAGNAGTSGAAGSFGSGAAGTASTAGASGSAGAGGAAGASSSTGAAGAGGAGTCVGCKVEVTYTCLSGASDSASFILNATNMGTKLFVLGDLTLRYWYTMDAGKEQELDCDTAQLTCAYIITSMSPAPAAPKFVAVTPPRTGANEYVEIAFTMGAVDVNGKTGPIQLRLHNKDYSPINQADDYSADCGATGQAHDTSKVTAYLKGVLVGGTEPP